MCLYTIWKKIISFYMRKIKHVIEKVKNGEFEFLMFLRGHLDHASTQVKYIFEKDFLRGYIC